MKKPVSAAAIAALVGALVLVACQSAAAASFGNNCAGYFSSSGTAYGLSEPIPSGGVITKWSMQIQTQETEGLTYTAVMKVLRTVAPQKLQVIGESHSVGFEGGRAAPFYANAVTRIPVRKGDFLSDEAMEIYEGSSIPKSLTCETQTASNVVGLVAGEPTLGETASFVETETGSLIPVSVEIEPDADGDGFGDVTQDTAAADPLVHAGCSTSTKSAKALPCPRPAASPLRARAVPHEEAIAVSVTTTVASTVKATGRVKLGRRTLTLTSGAKRAEVEKPNKFMLSFPPALRKRLAQLSPKRSLKAEVVVTSPGLEPARSITLKLRGQADE